jgi:hypothetical protein
MRAYQFKASHMPRIVVCEMVPISHKPFDANNPNSAADDANYYRQKKEEAEAN